MVPYGAYRCGDGDRAIGGADRGAIDNFCRDVYGRPEWIDDPRFNTVSGRRIDRIPLESAIEDAFATETRAEIARKLEAADIPSRRSQLGAAIRRAPAIGRSGTLA